MQKEEADAHKNNDDTSIKRIQKEYQNLKNAEKRRSNLNLSQQIKALDDLQNEIASLKFLDPAAGSGNFLTLSYICLRRLENRIIAKRQELTAETSGSGQYAGQIALGQTNNPIKVSIQQFFGIEIHDFAVTVAKTALWIAESQMMKETEDIIHTNLDFLPLKTNAYIVEGNALQMEWEDIVPQKELSYLMGNPPFLGYSMQNKSQKEDILAIFRDENGKVYNTAGKIDYVSGWFYKASKFMQGTNIRTALVATNSITQGEQVAGIWKPLYEQFGIHIDFAYRTFRWDSEATQKAHVHCVIIGFSASEKANRDKVIFDDKLRIKADNISPYIIDAPTIFIESRKEPLCKVLKMTTGNRPADGGHLIIEGEDYDEFIRKEPRAKKYIKELTGAAEFINNKKRYCLWLVDADPSEIRSMPEVMKRIEKCRQDRLSGADDRKKLALTPTLFRETLNPESYIIVPATSSEKRNYIPLGFLDSNTIPTNATIIIPGAKEYEFGILTSCVHMGWMRAVAGRLEMRYRYSKDIVYNNFPWPSPTKEQKQRIEQTAQMILEVRKKYTNSSLADLYDDRAIPKELTNAHQLNDKAVLAAYGIKPGDEEYKSESACVAMLMRMYQDKVEEIEQEKEEQAVKERERLEKIKEERKSKKKKGE